MISRSSLPARTAEGQGATSSGSNPGPISRRRFVTGVLVASGGLASVGLLAACAPSAPAPTQATQPAPAAAPTAAAKPTEVPKAPAAAAKAGGTLVAAGDSLGDNFDPSVSFQGWAHSWINANLCETLVDSRTGKMLPHLASEWSISPDGLVYTFKLRPNVKFHDGTPLDAEAVAFNYARQIDEKHPNYSKDSITRGVTLVGITKIEATGPLEVKFTRSRPAAGMLAQLALPWAGLLSPAAIKKFGVDYGRTPVGTGPFVFEKAAKGVEASMTANPSYWGKKPALDRVVVRAVPELMAVKAGLLTGEIDLSPNLDFKDLAEYRKNPKLKVDVTRASNFGYVAVNGLAPKLTDVRVRRALAHGIDTKKVIEVILYGEGEPPAGFATGAIAGFPQQELTNYYPYDPTKAKALLAEAGAGDLSLNLWVPTNGFFPAIAELVQADLSQIGVKAKIEKFDPARYAGQVTEGKHDLFIWDASTSSVDPNEIANSFFLSSNPRSKMRFGFQNSQFDDLLAKSDAEADDAKRAQFILQWQKLALDQVPLIVLYHGRFATALSARVQGFKTLPFRHAVYFDTITLS